MQQSVSHDTKDELIVVEPNAIDFLRISDGVGSVRFYGPLFYEVDAMVRAAAEALIKKLPGWSSVPRLGIVVPHEPSAFADWLCARWREDGVLPEASILECAPRDDKEVWQSAIRETQAAIERNYDALEALWGPAFAHVGS